MRRELTCYRFLYLIKARCARSHGGQRRPSIIANPAAAHSAQVHQRPLPALIPPPPRSGLRKRKTQQQLDPKAPLRGQRVPLSTRLPTSGRSDQGPEGRAKRGGADGRRRAASPVFATGRTAPPAVAARSGHIPTRARGTNGDPQRCRSKTRCVTERGRIVVAAVCGPTLPDALAFVRPADPAPGRRPDSECGHDARESPTPRGAGRLRDFRQPPWGEPRRSWPQRRALTGRSTDCPTRRKLTGP
ncbi:hypothetical protein SAMN05216532_3106 [Streptomyces sp. 2231.1]|nr:hypothetical protein SAMN05216532_3106 [Streptomyces sp. 2231.1]